MAAPNVLKRPDGRAELYADGSLTVRDAIEFCGIARTRLFVLMGAGELAYSLVGNRRLIPRRALVGLLARHARGTG